MLKKTHRLAKDSAIKAALKAGRGFFGPLLTLRFLKNPTQKRFTVVVSTKVDKRAVVRNRLKRMLREFIRLNIGEFENGDYVFIFKSVAARTEKTDLLIKLVSDLKKWKLLKTR